MSKTPLLKNYTKEEKKVVMRFIDEQILVCQYGQLPAVTLEVLGENRSHQAAERMGQLNVVELYFKALKEWYSKN